MAVSSYEELLAHAGHEICCVTYGAGERRDNVAVECETCSCVLFDFDALVEASPQGEQARAAARRSVARGGVHVGRYAAEEDRQLGTTERFSAARDLIADILSYAAHLPSAWRPPTYGPDAPEVIAQVAAGGVWCALADAEDPSVEALEHASAAFSQAVCPREDTCTRLAKLRLTMSATGGPTGT